MKVESRQLNAKPTILFIGALYTGLIEVDLDESCYFGGLHVKT